MAKNARDEFLLHLQTHPYFPIFLKDLQQKRPGIPHYNMMADNTEQWKYNSAQRQGYDLCCSIFNIPME
jgi:hypothetical protein